MSRRATGDYEHSGALLGLRSQPSRGQLGYLSITTAVLCHIWLRSWADVVASGQGRPVFSSSLRRADEGRQFDSSGWRCNSTECHRSGSGGYNANYADHQTNPKKRYSHAWARRKGRRWWTPCPNENCDGWAYDDRGLDACSRCGAAVLGPATRPSTVSIHPALLAQLQEDSPLKAALDKVIASGAVSVTKRKATDPHSDAQRALQDSTAALVKAQRQLAHHRQQLVAMREKLVKMETTVQEHEAKRRELIEAQHVAHQNFEQAVQAKQAGEVASTADGTQDVTSEATKLAPDLANVLATAMARIAASESELEAYKESTAPAGPASAAASASAASASAPVVHGELDVEPTQRDPVEGGRRSRSPIGRLKKPRASDASGGDLDPAILLQSAKQAADSVQQLLQQG